MRCFAKPEQFLSCITVARSVMLLSLEVFKIEEAFRKHLRLDLMK